MARLSQFELVEDATLSTSGFGLAVNVARHSAARDGEITITSTCVSMGEFQAEINRLIEELQGLLLEAEERFSDDPFGKHTLDLYD